MFFHQNTHDRCGLDLYFPITDTTTTLLNSLTDIFPVYPLVNRCLRERWARNSDNLCARSSLYVCGGRGRWRRNEIKRGNKKKRERNENKGDDRWARFAALASNCRVNSPRNLKIAATIYASGRCTLCATTLSSPFVLLIKEILQIILPDAILSSTFALLRIRFNLLSQILFNLAEK